MNCCESWTFEGESSWRTKKWTKGSNECQTSVRLQVLKSKFRRKWSKVQVQMETGEKCKSSSCQYMCWYWVYGWAEIFSFGIPGMSMFWPTSELSEWEKLRKCHVCLALAHSVVSTEKQINFRACLLTFLYCVFSNIVKLRKIFLMVLARWVVSPSVPMQTCFTANGATCSGLIQNVEEIQNSLHNSEIWSLIFTKGSQIDQY